MITQEQLKKLLHYNPSTGDLTWKHRALIHFKDKRSFSTWNARYQGAHAGSKDTDGYIQVTLNGRNYRSHRLAWLHMFGNWPADQIDHINHNRSDNRISNLRNATNTENGRNQSMKSNNSSGFTGVCWDARCSKWKSYIRIKGKMNNLGRFVNLIDAVDARISANKEYLFHNNHGVVLPNPIKRK